MCACVRACTHTLRYFWIDISRSPCYCAWRFFLFAYWWWCCCCCLLIFDWDHKWTVRLPQFWLRANCLKIFSSTQVKDTRMAIHMIVILIWSCFNASKYYCMRKLTMLMVAYIANEPNKTSNEHQQKDVY